MNISQMKTLVRTMVENKCHVVTMFWGPHGCGKTSAISQVAEDLGYDFYPLLLSQRESGEILGLPFQTLTDGVNTTDYSPPVFFHNAVTKGKLILFLDEFNMARKDIIASVFELLNERRLNGRKIKDDVFIVCAGNPDDARYDVSSLSESAKDRMMHIKVESDVSSWMDWATTKGEVDESITSFIKYMPDALRKHSELDMKFPVELHWSERSWERVNNMLKLNLNRNMFFECVRGIVGSEIATAYFKKLDEKPLSREEVLEYAAETRTRYTSWTEGAEVRFDLINKSADRILELAKEDVDNLAKGGVMDFFCDLPYDVFYRIIGDMISNLGGNKVKCYQYRDIVKNHPAFMAKIDSLISIRENANKEAV